MKKGVKTSTSVDLPLSHECKRVLAYGSEESERMNHEHIGTPDLFIGLLHQEHSLAAELFRRTRDDFGQGTRADAGMGTAWRAKRVWDD